MLQGQRLAAALSLGADRLLERQRIAAALAFHVPLRIGARYRIAQQQDELHRRIVLPDARRRGIPVHVDRRRVAENFSAFRRLEIGVIASVVDRRGLEVVLVVEEMHFLDGRHGDLGVLEQIRRERGRAAFLRSRDDESNPGLRRQAAVAILVALAAAAGTWLVATRHRRYLPSFRPITSAAKACARPGPAPRKSRYYTFAWRTGDRYDRSNALRLSSVSASSTGLSMRRRRIRGKRTAMPDLWRGDRAMPSKPSSNTSVGVTLRTGPNFSIVVLRMIASTSLISSSLKPEYALANGISRLPPSASSDQTAKV